MGSSTSAVNPARTSYADDPNLVAPLETRWSRSLGQEIGLVIYGDGRLYARVGSALVALDAATGKTLWRVAAGQTFGRPSFDGGLVLSEGHDDALEARSARTGTLQWRTPNTSSTGVSPLVSGGRVYAEDSSRISALSLQTGAVLWRADTSTGRNLLSTDGARVFVTSGTGRTEALEAGTGRKVWTHLANSGGGEEFPVAHRGRVYSSDSSGVFDGATGARLGNYGTEESIFAGDLSILRLNGVLRAQHLPTGRVRWRIRGVTASQGSEVHGRSVAIGRSVYAFGENQRLLVNSLDGGRRQQVVRLRAGPSDTGESTIASAPGLLLVPTGSRLTAYQSVFRPAATGVAAGATADVEYGRRPAFAGVVGVGLRARRRVTVQLAGHGSRRFRTLGPLTTQADGFFGASLRLSRNGRVRISVGAARSAPVRLYVYPRYRTKLRRARADPNRIRASVRVSGPRDVRLAQRRVVLYFAQPRRKRYVRLGAARLRRAGKGRAHATVRFNAVRRIGRGDFLVYCIPRASRLGLGRSDALDGRCGARRIPLR